MVHLNVLGCGFGFPYWEIWRRCCHLEETFNYIYVVKVGKEWSATYEARYIQLLDRYLPKRVIVHIKSTTANFNLHPITLRTIREPFFHDAPAVRASNFIIPLACHVFLGLWHILVASRNYQGYLVYLRIRPSGVRTLRSRQMLKCQDHIGRYFGT